MRMSAIPNDTSPFCFTTANQSRARWLLVTLLAMLSLGATVWLGDTATAQPPDSTAIPVSPGTVLSEPLALPVGIKFDPGQRDAEAAQQQVVLIPGLLAGAESLQSVRRELQARHVTTSTFYYTSSQGIAAAADLLSRELQRLAQVQPNTKLVLITHSMGGIVARAVVEDSKRFSANVTKLLMIAPPNHGSALAELSTRSLRQTLLADQSIPEDTLQAVDQLIEQFFGRAKTDLRPDSPFLKSLNQLSRNPNVEYAIFCGTGGPVPAEALTLSFLVGGLLLPDDAEQQKAFDEVRKLAMLPEWIRGSGDGVVSVKSARLPGVKCFETFAFGHNDFGISCSSEASTAVKQLIEMLN